MDIKSSKMKAHRPSSVPLKSSHLHLFDAWHVVDIDKCLLNKEKLTRCEKYENKVFITPKSLKLEMKSKIG